MTSLLISEPPLQVLPILAVKIGLNEAIVVQQIHYWLLRSTKIRDGHKWVYNSMEKWNEQFPFWSRSTLKRTFSSLEKQGIIISANYNRAGFDKTKWYRIDYRKLEPVSQPLGQNEPTSGSNWGNALGQNEPTNTIDYTETTSETTNTPLPPKGGERAEPVELPFGDPEPAPNPSKATDELEESFEKIWRDYPRKAGKKQAFRHYKKWRKENKAHTAAYLAKRLGLYKAYLAANHTDPRYILQGSTWFNGRFEDDYVIRSPEPKDMYDRHYE